MNRIDRRGILQGGGVGLAAAGAAATGAVALSAGQAYAQSAPGSLLGTVLDRGKLLVGTGSTNAPWHFENDKGELVGTTSAPSCGIVTCLPRPTAESVPGAHEAQGFPRSRPHLSSVRWTGGGRAAAVTWRS